MNDSNPVLGLLFGLLITAICFGSYFLPTIVAWRRHHRNLLALGVLNLLLGWTVVGWVIAIVWSLMRQPEQA